MQSPQSPAQGRADRSPAETPRAPGLLINQVQTPGQAISSCSSGPGRRPGKHSGKSRSFAKGWMPGALSRGRWRPAEPRPAPILHRWADLWPPRYLRFICPSHPIVMGPWHLPSILKDLSAQPSAGLSGRRWLNGTAWTPYGHLGPACCQAPPLITQDPAPLSKAVEVSVWRWGAGPRFLLPGAPGVPTTVRRLD